ncbi:hypothetical protein [Actinoplanes solisilvae]|uniref:hypothetical protein n=1 Tax=Actinoplanes solisilvae TaxID=2486853 RepID=UPI00196B00EA|nr:hypothetical protein [Actinoplanes solisilvae]
MRLGWALGGIVLVALAGGCTSDETPQKTPVSQPPASAPVWSEPASYSYVLARGCDDAKPLGRYQVKVADGAVASTDRLDATVVTPSAGADEDLGPATGETGEEIEAFTLQGLLDMAQTAKEDGGEVTTVADGTDGHPVKVVINVSDEGPAGAECWNVSDYKAG